MSQNGLLPQIIFCFAALSMIADSAILASIVCMKGGGKLVYRTESLKKVFPKLRSLAPWPEAESCNLGKAFLRFYALILSKITEPRFICLPTQIISSIPPHCLPKSPHPFYNKKCTWPQFKFFPCQCMSLS